MGFFALIGMLLLLGFCFYGLYTYASKQIDKDDYK